MTRVPASRSASPIISLVNFLSDRLPRFQRRQTLYHENSGSSRFPRANAEWTSELSSRFFCIKNQRAEGCRIEKAYEARRYRPHCVSHPDWLHRSAHFQNYPAQDRAHMQPPHLQRVPEAASDLIYRTLDGEPQHLDSSKGQVVFLDLWGTWCVQCVAEMPTVQRLYDHYRNDPQIKFLIVSRLDSPSAVRSYARRNHLNLPFYVTRDEDIPQSMQLNQFPSTFIYAKDGTLVSKHVGAADWSDRSVISFIDQLKEL
jgi:thiol-disulfide isomerase/thioredoxin